MKKSLILAVFLSFLVNMVVANDGAFIMEGNQLIPIQETDISIRKEVLNIVERDGVIYVTVDYTFFNPSEEKKLLVGFEAVSPSGAVDGTPKNGGHPYMHNFTVSLNNKLLNSKVAIVDNHNYYTNGKIHSKTVKEVMEAEDFIPESPDFYYVYHFDATFKRGENKLIHTYSYDQSGSVMTPFSIDYVLTAANRWANKQIDDFTLNLSVGNNTVFTIAKTFFSDKSQWHIEDGSSIDMENAVCFATRSGGISFSTQNFKAAGELQLSSVSIDDRRHFDAKQDDLPPTIYNGKSLYDTYPLSFYPPYLAKDKVSYKILRNMPFALRGYIFKTPYIQAYYERQSWYKPNPDYTHTSIEQLSDIEKEWLGMVHYFASYIPEEEPSASLHLLEKSEFKWLEVYGLSGKNKPNGLFYRLREEVSENNLPRTIKTSNLIPFIVDKTDFGYMALYRLPMGAEDYKFIVVLYNHNREIWKEIDINELSDNYNCELQDIRYADNHIYYNLACPSYSDQLSGECSQLFCVDIDREQVQWQTTNLISNNIFVIYKQYIVAAYGFTNEPDYIYLIDRESGEVLDNTKLQSAHQYIEVKDDKIYVIDYKDIMYIFVVK